MYIYNSYSQVFSYFKEIALPSINAQSAQQKKIILIVSLAFGFLAACYLTNRLYSTPSFTKINKENRADMIPSPDGIIQSPISDKVVDTAIKIVNKEFIFKDAPFPSCHASTIIEIESGVFMAAWFGGTKEKAPDVGIWTSIYKDGLWSPPKETIKNDGVPFWNPVLFKMPSGEILLFYKHGPNPREWSGFLIRSFDHGETWEPEEALILSNGEKGLGPIKNKPLLLEDGTLICGTSIEDQQPNICYIERSQDGGKTWERSTPIGPLHLNDKSYGIIQPTLLQTNDGLVMIGRPRDHLGHVWYSKSLDQGLTWLPVEKLDLTAPDSGLDAITLKDGRHLLVFNNTNSGRKSLDVAISDDGKNWTPILNLEKYVPSLVNTTAEQEKKEHIEFSYPAVIQAEDERIHITYTWNRKRIVHAILLIE